MAKGWGLYRTGGRMIVGGARAGARAGREVGRSVDDARAVRKQSRAARSGILGPGDPQPPGGVTGYYDFSGVADDREIRPLTGQGYPLGSLVLPAGWARRSRRATGPPLSLPFEVLQRHALVVGPSGSGKTFNIIVPWMVQALREGHSVVAVDVKGDLAGTVERFAARTGGLDVPVVIWDYSNPSASKQWNWVRGLDGDEAIDAGIRSILGQKDEKSTADPYFYRRDYQLFRGLLRLVKSTFSQTMTARDLLALISNQTSIEQLVLSEPSTPGATDFGSVMMLSPGEWGRAISGVTTALGSLDTDALKAVTTRSQINLADIRRVPQLLVIGAPLKGGQVAEAASGLMLGQILQHLYRGFTEGGRRVMFMIDEAARLTNRLDYEEILTVSRSAGVSACLALQDVTQIDDEADQSSILSNCAALTSFTGVSPKTATAFGERLGSRPIATGSVNSSGYGWGRTNDFSQSTIQAPVLGDREIMSPPFGAYCAITHVKAPEAGITTKPVVTTFASG